MRSERERDALADIIFNIDRALESLARRSPTMPQDWLADYAAVRRLEIISEASRRLTPELQARHPDQPWRSIMDSGNVYRHGYHNVDMDEVWREADRP